MTVIQPNSVAGINSITVQSGDSLSVHKSDGSLIRTITADSGITTFSKVSISGVTTQFGQINFGTAGTASTIFANGNAAFSGIVTASQFSVGTAVTIGKTNGNASFAGIVTATAFVDDGTNLLTQINTNTTSIATKASTGKAIAMAMIFG